jgi:urease accessory protein UreF
MKRLMLDQIQNLPRSATEILGDLTALAEQIGGPEGLGQLAVTAVSLGSARVDTVLTLERFLNSYASTVLIPHELPTVAQAYACGGPGHVRELIALDQQLRRVPELQALAEASRQVGRMQLRRLRPLRGARVVQRYLKVVESGEAQGWHTIVFGLVLALYSLPLRQGLVHFAQQTLSGFVDSATPRLQIGVADRQRLTLSQSEVIRGAVESVITQHVAAPDPSPTP